jgi:RNA methyltransferase, TrmH family
LSARRVEIASRSNPVLLRVRKLLADPSAYRKHGQIWLEGDHLLRAAVAKGLLLQEVLVARASEHDAALQPLLQAAPRLLVVDDRLWRELSSLASPAPIAAMAALPEAGVIEPEHATVVLERIQDAGNLGSILRSAAALGVPQVIALSGCASLWSPKVLRAGMGAHFALRLFDAAEPDLLADLRVPMLATSPHAAQRLTDAALPHPCAWVFGHEGQGVSAALAQRCAMQLAIPQPGGEESLNVAAAAAICLYESMRRGAGQ